MGPGERAFVSIFVNWVITSDGVVRRRLDISSRMTERSIGSAGLSGVPSEVWRMDLSATLSYFANMRIRTLPYFSRRRLRARVANEEADCLPKSRESVMRYL